MLLDWFLVAFIPKTAPYTGNGMFSGVEGWNNALSELGLASRAAARAIQLKQSLEDRREDGAQPERFLKQPPDRAFGAAALLLHVAPVPEETLLDGIIVASAVDFVVVYSLSPFSKTKGFVLIQFLSQNGEEFRVARAQLDVVMLCSTWHILLALS